MSYARKLYGSAALLFVALLLGCTAASTDEASLARYRAQAQALVEQQQFREAVAAYQHVVQLDPKDDESHYQQALLYLLLGEPEDIHHAHQTFLRVVKLKRSHIGAHLKLGHLYLIGEEYAKARLHADAILAAEPTHSEAHLIRGVSYVREKRLQNGIDEFRRAIEFDPHGEAAYLELARAYALRRDLAEAESVLRQSLETNPQSVETRMALGDVHVAAGHNSDAVNEYLRGLELDEKNGDLYARLAGASVRQRQFGEAEQYYRRWIKAVPDDAEAHTALARFYSSTGRLRDAEASLQRARRIDPSSRVAHEALIALYLETKRLPEAGREIDLFLKPNPRDGVGRVLEARLVFQQGDTEKAIQLLREVARDAPKSAAAHHTLGVVLAQRQDFPQAVSALKEARSLDPDSTEIRVTLAKTYLVQGSVNLAINEAAAVLEAHPQHVTVRKLLVDAYLLGDDVKRARETLLELMKFTPEDPFVHHRLGVVSGLQRRPADAIAHFERALERTPSSIESLEEVVSTLISQGQVSQAHERVRRQVALNPRDPRFHDLLGRILAHTKKFQESEAAFKKAIALDGMLLTSYAHLSELYVQQGKVDQAIKEFEMILEQSPRQVWALMTLGLLHEHRKDYSGAIARYEEALRVNSKFAPAANNLAWILVEHVGDKERALPYAEIARQGLPHDPYVADTMGWIYYQKQMYAKSVSLLKEAVDRLPRHPLILYHYGIAQHANKQRDEAIKALNRFLTLAPDDPRARDVKKVLAELT